jgi:hypothetical protein
VEDAGERGINDPNIVCTYEFNRKKKNKKEKYISSLSIPLDMLFIINIKI